MKKKTAVIGATPKKERYAYLATERLTAHGHEAIPLGIRKGMIEGIEIITDWPEKIDELDTVTMYVGPARQEQYYDYIIGLHPKRVIFNPGTENPIFYELLAKENIEYEEACTLVLLSTSAY